MQKRKVECNPDVHLNQLAVLSDIYSSIYGFHVACQKILLESKRHPHLRNGFQKSYKQVPRHLIQVYHHCQGN